MVFLLKLKDSFHTYALTTTIFWALGKAGTRIAMRHFSAGSFGLWRCFIASCVLTVVVLVTKIRLPKKEDIKWVFAAGGFGFFLYMIAFNKGSETVTVATASVILATAPVVTAILASILYKEKLNALQWFATFLELAGVMLITLMEGAFTVNHGLIWLFLAILSVSLYNIFQRKLTKTYSGLQASTYSMFAGTLMLAIFSPQAIQEMQSAPPVQVLYVVVLGVFSSALAYATWSIAFEKAKLASSVSNYMFVTPFLSSLMGVWLADEIPTVSTLVGGAIILSGMLLFNFEAKIREFFQT